MVSVNSGRVGLVLANQSVSGYGLMLPSHNHYLRIIGKKPLIYYPISLLMLSGIKNIEVLVEEVNVKQFSECLSSITYLGVNFTIKIVSRSMSTIEAISESSSDGRDIAVVEDDLLLVVRGLLKELGKSNCDTEISTFFGMLSSDPTRHINCQLDSAHNIVKAVRFPRRKVSNSVSPRLFFINNKNISEVFAENNLDFELDDFFILSVKV